jgi:hypothetical protein
VTLVDRSSVRRVRDAHRMTSAPRFPSAYGRAVRRECPPIGEYMIGLASWYGAPIVAQRVFKQVMRGRLYSRREALEAWRCFWQGWCAHAAHHGDA